MTDHILSPGDAIKSELEKRGWTQSDLAMVLGKHQPSINQMIQGKFSITPDVAMALGAAFGNSPEYWLGLDASYRLSLLDPNPEVQRRARLLGYAPVKEMEKRGWIKRTDAIDDLENELCQFFNVQNLDQPPIIRANARQKFKSESLSPTQIAWCFRAAKLAPLIDTDTFRPATFESALPEIRKLADFPEKTKYLTKLLSEAGVRLVIIEPLAHSKIDGAAFWLADDAPVVVLSVRYDRIDCLWFTLAHELIHIRHRDSQSVDSEIVGEESRSQTEAIEERANKEGAALLIPSDKLKSFILRVKPFYSKAKITQFAIRMQVHPGIVVGQLQNRKEIPWGANREMLAKVRDIATSTTVTDGWGRMAPVL